MQICSSLTARAINTGYVRSCSPFNRRNLQILLTGAEYK